MHSNWHNQVHFDVFSSPQHNQPWGKFTISTDTSSLTSSDPVDQESVALLSHGRKVSIASGALRHTLLLARLRFKPDVSYPTLY